MMDKARVLIVDDDDEVSGAFFDLMEELDIYEPHRAPDATRAIALIEKHGIDFFDAFLIDQRMPGMTGCDLIRKMVEYDRDPLIYVVTAEDDNIALGIAESFDRERLPIKHYVSKPVPRSVFSVDLREDIKDHRLKKHIYSVIEHSNRENREINRKLAKAVNKMEESDLNAARINGAISVIAAIKHEFGNYATGVAGKALSLQYILEDDEDRLPRDVIEKIREVQSGIEELSEKINENLRFMSKIMGDIEEEPRQTQISRIIMTAISRLRDAMTRARIIMRNEFESDVSLSCYEYYLSEAIYQIVKNSIEAMKNGGTLHIKTGLDKNTGKVVITITDTGPGIAPDLARRVYVPFCSDSKISGRKGGSIVYRIVTGMHNGNVQITTPVKAGTAATPPSGTTVTITLPVSSRVINPSVIERRMT